MKFDHLGVIVSDLTIGREHFSRVYNVKEWTKEFVDEINGVYVQFFRDCSGICFELVAPINNKSPICNALTKKINILNHVAYLVDDINEEFNKSLDGEFIVLGSAQKAVAYNMKNIQFFYSEKLGYCLELIESSKYKHTFYSLDELYSKKTVTNFYKK